MKNTFDRSDKFLVLSTSCFLMLFAATGWVLTRDNSTAAVVIPTPIPTPSPNGFDLYIAAATSLVPANPAVDQIDDRVVRTPQQAAQLYTSARRTAWLASNTTALGLFERALGAKCRQPAQRGVYLTAPFAPLRELARCKTIESKEYRSRGLWNTALGTNLDTLKMGHDIEHGASYGGALTGIAIQSIALTSTKDIPAHLTASEAKQRVRQLEKIVDERSSPSDVLTEDKFNSIAEMQQLFGNPNWRNNISSWTGSNAPPTLSQQVQNYRLSPRQVVNDYVSYVDRVIAETKKPYISRDTHIPLPGNAVSASFAGVAQTTWFSYARRDADEDGFLLRLALRAYRLENGAYPDKLDQLVPNTLKKVPLDAFGNGEEWRYRKNGDSYLAYSIGPDEKDNNGVSIPPSGSLKKVMISNDSQGDYVIGP